MQSPEISVVEISSDIKVPFLEEFHVPFGPLFVDNVFKFLIKENQVWEVQNKIRLRIITIISADGVSFRKLKTDDIRTYLTWKKKWKVRLERKEYDILSLWEHFADTTVNVFGVSFITPLYRFVVALCKKIAWNSPDKKDIFKASLRQTDEKIWTLRTRTRKFNSLKRLPKDICTNDDPERQWKPTVIIESDVDLQNISGRLHFRHNLPLDKISKNHARDVTIDVSSYLFQVLDAWSLQIWWDETCLNLWRISFRKIGELNK